MAHGFQRVVAGHCRRCRLKGIVVCDECSECWSCHGERAEIAFVRAVALVLLFAIVGVCAYLGLR